MLKAGVGPSVIMAITGHKTRAKFKRYNRIDLDDGREAMWKVDSYLSGDQKREKAKKGEDEKKLLQYYSDRPKHKPAYA